MKKILIFASIFKMITIFSNSLKACHYSFDSKTDQTKIGDVFEVKVTVIYEHRRCVIELEDTQFKTENMEIISKSDWNMEKRGTYSILLTLKSNKSGTAKLEVVRECSKKGISSADWQIPVIEQDISMGKTKTESDV